MDWALLHFVIRPEQIYFMTTYSFQSGMQKNECSKLCVESGNKWKYCSLFFINEIGLAAFISYVFTRKSAAVRLCSFKLCSFSYFKVVGMSKLKYLSKNFFCFRKACWEYRALLKTTNAMILICRNFRTNIPMLRQLIDLNFKWRELIKMMPCLFAVRETSPFKF